MSCCGSRRAAQSRSTGLRAPRPAPTPEPGTAPAPSHAVTLEYRGPLPMVLPSPSGGAPLAPETVGERVSVSAADAAILQRTGWFEPAGD